MNWYLFTFLLELCLKSTSPYSWDPWHNIHEQSARYNIIYHSQYYHEAEQKIAAIRDIRFMYEASPHYEMGYVMGEILERYRKMIELVKLCFQHHGEHVLTKVNRADRSLSLYLEIYHLVQMMHEIPQKYKDDPEYKDIYVVPTVQELQIAQKDLVSKMKIREKAKKKERKFEKKMRDAFLSKGIVWSAPKKKKTQWREINYGWEIDKDYFYSK